MYNYVHGGDVYSLPEGKRLIDFSANINPLGLPKGVKNALKTAINVCADYPDPFCRKLTEKLAEYHNLEKNYIFLSNGAADVLFKLALAIKPAKAILLAPTFADYEKALSTVNCEINYFNLSEKNDFCVDEGILHKINNDTDMVVICNPNNPTGQLTDEKLLLKILDKCRSTATYLLVDECFMDFVDKEEAFSLKEYLSSYENLIILKAFTKTYAMAGIRLGYCLTSNGNIIDRCRENGQDWSVSTLAQAAGLSALDEEEYLARSKEYIKRERHYLMYNLRRLGFKVYGSKANYIFFSADSIPRLAEKLQKEGFLIRKCANYHNLDDNYYRIAVRTISQNKLLIKAVRKLLKNENIASNN
ncbi:MAG: pyridoxal phosphate-dependent aminotransferase [Acidaminococcaceae bacterium]